MAIKAEQIDKKYNNFTALDKVSFEVESGEIVGLLGPNGAGKSTLMKILSGVMFANSGKASICNFDLLTNSLEAKRLIGYLPESNPLYQNMYIKEYLEFSASFYKLKENKSARINEMIELTDLGDHLKKKIGFLSKGLKQRVGLSQALLHDPRVLILDEPMSGLDPNQIVEIRNLILSLGKNKTILFSSHIMQEVEALCERVIILNEGHVIADGKTSDVINKNLSTEIISVEFDKEVEKKIILSLKSVKKVIQKKNNKWEIESVENEDIRKELMAFSVAQNITILSLNQQENNLEEVFQKLTKK